MRRLYSDQDGQATVEYILILSVVIVASSAFIRKFMTSFDSVVLKIGANLEKDLKTGRAPLDVWNN